MGSPIERIAIIGAGVIGSGWAARFLGAGLNVDAWDPDPDARNRTFAAIDAAWPAMARRGIAQNANPSRLTFHERLEDCVAGADFIQENAPEREALKQELLAQHRRRRQARRHHRLVDLGPAADPPRGQDDPTRALRRRPPLQPGLLAAAGRSGRRGQGPRPRPSTAPPHSIARSACGRCTCARRSMASSPTG